MIKAFPEPYEVSEMELFPKLAKPLINFVNSSILDVWHDTECTSQWGVLIVKRVNSFFAKYLVYLCQQSESLLSLYANL